MARPPMQCTSFLPIPDAPSPFFPHRQSDMFTFTHSEHSESDDDEKDESSDDSEGSWMTESTPEVDVPSYEPVAIPSPRRRYSDSAVASRILGQAFLRVFFYFRPPRSSVVFVGSNCLPK